MKTTEYMVEATDTFGGETNYAWVKRIPFCLPSVDDYKKERRQMVRMAKSLLGWTGLRCETEDYSDYITIRPKGICQVAFVGRQPEH